jgi:3-dehydroquinate synthetase
VSATGPDTHDLDGIVDSDADLDSDEDRVTPADAMASGQAPAPATVDVAMDAGSVEGGSADSDADSNADLDDNAHAGVGMDAHPDADADMNADASADDEATGPDAQPSNFVAPIRQWISLPKGSCDVRVGTGIADSIGEILRGPSAGRRVCALFVEQDVDAALLELVQRQLCDAGFNVQTVTLHEAVQRTPEAVVSFFHELARLHVTIDDLVCAVGHVNLLSLAASACNSWCSGVSLTCIPLDSASALEGVISPRGLDIDGKSELIDVRGCAKHLFVDLNIINCDPQVESSRLMRALAARIAMADAEKSYSALWDRAQELASGDTHAIADQLVETLRSSGRLATSTSIGLRQALGFGGTFVRALQALLPDDVPESTLVAEALRFTTRLSCGKGELSVEDVLMSDELLERLDLPQLTCHVDPDLMIRALKEDRFLRSSRFLLGLPRSLGRVRLSTIDDELLAEHVCAWCASRDQK